MNYNGIVRGFCTYNSAQREALKRDLSLSFSDQLLSLCMAHYGNVEKREPYIDELQTLSALSEILSAEHASLFVRELFTNDTYVADTYADFLKKKKSLQGGTQACTLREIPSIATRYLERTYASRRTVKQPPILTYTRHLLPSASVSSVSPASSLFRLQFSDDTAFERAGDVLILLRPTENETPLCFARSCERILDRKDVAAYMKGSYTVHGMLLRELLKIADGIRIDLCALSPFDTTLPLTVLSESFDGCRLLRVSVHKLSSFLETFSELGIRCAPFAQITDDGKYTFVRKKGDSFSVQTQFLCALSVREENAVYLQDEKCLSPAKIGHELSKGLSCGYLHDSHQKTATTYSIGSHTVAAASAFPENAFFKTALLTAIAPVISLALCGKDHTTQRFSFGYELPQFLDDGYTAGECVSLMLGIYRAQIELAIPSPDYSIRLSEQASHPSVSAFSYADTAATPSALTKEGATVYAISIPLDTDGYPDFTGLRVLLSELASMVREGAISSARLLINESIAEGLFKMQGDFIALLRDTAIAAEDRLSLAILCESEQELPYRPVATTKAMEAESPQNSLSVPSLSQALFWKGIPEVTVLAKADDTDAAILTSHLLRHGADVRFFACEEVSEIALARAILHSQLLILCRDTVLPITDSVTLAAETFRRSGGTILCLANSEAAGGIRAERGISHGLLESFFETV